MMMFFVAGHPRLRIPTDVTAIPSDQIYEFVEVAPIVAAHNRGVDIPVFADFVRGVVPKQSAAAVGTVHNWFYAVCGHEPANAIAASRRVNFTSIHRKQINSKCAPNIV